MTIYDYGLQRHRQVDCTGVLVFGLFVVLLGVEFGKYIRLTYMANVKEGI